MSIGGAAQLNLFKKPEHSIINKSGETIELKAGVPNALIYVKECKNCQASFTEKAVKVIFENCEDISVDCNSTVLAGTMEFIRCNKIVLNLRENGMIPIIMADSTTELTVNVLQHTQFESIYTHQSSGLKVNVGTAESKKNYPVTIPSGVSDHFQFIVHWEVQENEAEPKLICEKVVREGVYPTTEQKLKKDKAREERDLEKLAAGLVEGIRIGPKGDGKSGSTWSGSSKPGADTGKGRQTPSSTSKPRNPPTAPSPKPSANHNIKEEDEKMEYFDEEDELEAKLDTLAEWVRESKHCVMFTGAGISTSTGIPDFRSGMNTVLSTGPGVWELQAKGKERRAGAAVTNILQAIPSKSHMAIVKLHEVGLVKFTVSQNVDGLHLRSGVPAGQIAELHGNANLEKCTVCGAKYLRDFDTARLTHDHFTGRNCDNPKCRGALIDSIINFGEGLPREDLEKSYEEAAKCDLCIVLGSSLRVFPAADIPATIIRNGQKVVICNLQKTPLNAHCALEVFTQIDALMSGLMKRLGLDIPPFCVKRRVALDVTATSLTIQGLDLVSDTPYSFIKQVSVRVSKQDQDKKRFVAEDVLAKEPFCVSFPQALSVSAAQPLHVEITLGFHGHYGEPEMVLSARIESIGRTMYNLEYELTRNRWGVLGIH